jgi:membrane fusion protein (multidrug efflux system)
MAESGEQKTESEGRGPSEHAPAKKKGRPFYKRPVGMTILILLIVGGGLTALIFWLHSRHFESTDDAFIEGHVIAISPKVSGLISEVLVDDNTRVNKGDLLVKIDPRDFQAALAQAKGDLAAAQGKFQEAQAQVQVNQADIEQAEAQQIVAETNAENAQRDLNRWLALDERARSKEQMDDAIVAQRSTAAQLQNAKAQVIAAKAQLFDAEMAVQTAQGNLDAAKGALEQANNNLGYCTISAETDGVITRKSVEPGMYVQVDQPLFSLVQYDVWVIANFKETQLTQMRPGQGVQLSVDAYPGRKLTGTVQSIQDGTGSRFTLLPPENATGNYVKIVQRVPVKIVLDPGQNDDGDHLLSPGMSVEPDVRVR